MSKVNENIKNFREMRKLTQKTFSEMLNKSRNVISNWERGENSPDLDTIIDICKALNVTPNHLFGWDPCPDYVKYLERLHKLDDQEMRINKQIEQLNSELVRIKSLRKQMVLEDPASLLDLPTDEE